MFVAALITIAKTWKQSKYSSTDERIRKIGMEHYSAIKKKEILHFVTTWMNLRAL